MPLLAVASAQASTTVGIFGILDEIRFEPDRFLPDTICIGGVFVLPRPVSSGLHLPPQRGYLYFSLETQFAEATLRDWDALEAATGTGQVVGFGRYWVASERADGIVNSSLEAELVPDCTTALARAYPQPSERGVVTTFDTPEDICPRFGRSSGEIVAALSAAYAPDVDRPAPPVCEERIGLLASSDLDSAHRAQSRDPAWADGAEAVILEQIAQSGVELADIRLDCRETVCRAFFVFPSREYQESAGNRLVATAIGEAPGFARGAKIARSRDGPPTVEYYRQREVLPVTRGGDDAP